MSRSLALEVLKLHNEGLVCDYINTDFVIICVDNKVNKRKRKQELFIVDKRLNYGDDSRDEENTEESRNTIGECSRIIGQYWRNRVISIWET